MALNIQKASFWKRISAFLFDFIVTAMLTVGLATILSAVMNVDKHFDELNDYQIEYETNYGVDFDITEEDYNKLSEEGKQQYELADAAMRQDERLAKTNQTIFFLILVMVSISLLLGILTVQFVAPLFFKNGQTLGKKIFGIAVVRSNCVKASNPVLFIRAVIGLYVIETMFPVALLIMIYFGLLGLIGGLTIIFLGILQLSVLIVTQNHCSIHDLLTDTVVVDMASQRIFDSEEALIAYKEQLHAEEVAQKDYA